MNLKNERIRKLWWRGIKNPARIAKKIGDSEKRVRHGLRLMQLEPEGVEDGEAPSGLKA